MGAKLKREKLEQSFEDSLRELEDILKELEGAKVPLEDLLEKYQRARECLCACRTKLDAAELKIKQLGDSSVTDFDFEK